MSLVWRIIAQEPRLCGPDQPIPTRTQIELLVQIINSKFYGIMYSRSCGELLQESPGYVVLTCLILRAHR